MVVVTESHEAELEVAGKSEIEIRGTAQVEMFGEKVRGKAETVW